MLEKDVVKKVKKMLKGYWVKIHGGRFQQVGLPDMLGWNKGKSYAFEFKILTLFSSARNYVDPIRKCTPIQIRSLETLTRVGVTTYIIFGTQKKMHASQLERIYAVPFIFAQQHEEILIETLNKSFTIEQMLKKEKLEI